MREGPFRIVVGRSCTFGLKKDLTVRLLLANTSLRRGLEHFPSCWRSFGILVAGPR
jgi:hypothetical protein